MKDLLIMLHERVDHRRDVLTGTLPPVPPAPPPTEPSLPAVSEEDAPPKPGEEAGEN
jgi:hypothetical protein